MLGCSIAYLINSLGCFVVSLRILEDCLSIWWSRKEVLYIFDDIKKCCNFIRNKAKGYFWRIRWPSTPSLFYYQPCLREWRSNPIYPKIYLISGVALGILQIYMSDQMSRVWSRKFTLGAISALHCIIKCGGKSSFEIFTKSIQLISRKNKMNIVNLVALILYTILLKRCSTDAGTAR